MLDEAIGQNSEEALKAALRDLQKRQTNDPKWDRVVDGQELIRLQGLLEQSKLQPITQAEKDALKAQGVKPALTPVEQKLVISANEKATAQRPPQQGGSRR